jgi:hypothetical protein
MISGKVDNGCKMYAYFKDCRYGDRDTQKDFRKELNIK